MKAISNMSDSAGKMWLTVGLGLMLSVGAVVSSRAAATGSEKQLHGHVPAIVAHLPAVGEMAPTTNMNLAIGLPLRNLEELTNLLQQVYDPSSTNYHRFLTPEEFTSQFGPSREDYQAVIDFATINGLTVTHTHGNRMLVDVAGKVSDVERSFHVKMKTYHHPTQARDFFAPDTEPSVSANLPVLSVQGMNNYVQPHAMLQKMPASKINPASGSGPGGGYIGLDFRNAYVPGTTLNGSGQVVGLMQFDGYFASDIAAYAALAGLTNVPLQNVLLDGFNGTPGFNNDEVCLDIEMCMSMAPALAKIVVFEAGPFGNPNDILNSMAASNQIKQLSASWGYTIDATTEQIYRQFALQGQTFLNCSGDGDAWLGPIPYGSCEDPNITIVGGTTLTMNGTGASYASETAWNWGFIGNYNWNPDGYFGSSGGISTTVSIPSWQQGISMTSNHGSATFRNVPDIALTADNIFVISSGGVQGIYGGTSCATPLWAGFMALVNQQVAANTKSSIGFLAPAVYTIAKTTSYTNCFHDTITGDNTWDLSPTNFFAVAGYDLCTGLGTPNGTNMINALAGVGSSSITPTPLSPPPPPYGSTLAVLNGGNPNGTWTLFVQDDRQLDSGSISNGWILNLTTANPVGFSANLVLSMGVSSTNILVGGDVIYGIGVTNYGPSTSSNIVVSISLPQGGVPVATNITKGFVSRSGSQLFWNVGTLTNAGAQLFLTVQANVAGSNILSVANASADTLDPNTADNGAYVAINVGTLTPPQLSSGAIGANGAFIMTVTGSPVQTIIQASTNLVIWVPVFTNLSPFTSPFNYTNSTATNYPYRFYRAVTAQ